MSGAPRDAGEAGSPEGETDAEGCAAAGGLWADAEGCSAAGGLWADAELAAAAFIFAIWLS